MTKEKYIAAEKAFIANFDLKVGDTVKVLRKVKDKEGGWDNVWDEDDMDDSIGEELTIESFSIHAHGITLSNFFDYPYFCLELVSPSNITIELDSGDYNAEVSADGKNVTVGCQEISFETVQKIHNAMIDMQRTFVAPIKKVVKKKVAAKKVARRR